MQLALVYHFLFSNLNGTSKKYFFINLYINRNYFKNVCFVKFSWIIHICERGNPTL